MKKNIITGFCLLFFPSVVFAASQQMIDLPLRTSQEKAEAQLGKPQKKTQRDNLTIDWYGSIAATYADLLYFQEEVLVFKSLNVADQQAVLVTYLQNWGNPAVSLHQYSAEQDDLPTRIYVWPEKGKDILTIGEATGSAVIREETFAPMTLDQYYESWGKAYKGNTPVSIVTPTPSVQNTTNKPIEKSNNLRLYLTIVGVIGIALLLVVKIKAKL